MADKPNWREQRDGQMAALLRIKNEVRGQYKSERQALVNAIHRCHNEAHIEYRNYGARGITVCEEWQDRELGFASFINHIGTKPESKLTLERIDNDKGYEPGNVKWASRSEQACNRNPYTSPRKGKITLDGRSQTSQEWADELGITLCTFLARLRVQMPEERILTKGRLPRINQQRKRFNCGDDQ